MLPWKRGRLTCLFVDDDPGVRDLVALNLKAEGIQVHLSDTGFGVEDKVRKIRPDLILLDVMMPGRDGHSVLKSLKKSTETSDIPVVLLTARATDAEIWEGWQNGADYYLTKPFNVDHLVDYLRMVVQESKTAKA